MRSLAALAMGTLLAAGLAGVGAAQDKKPQAPPTGMITLTFATIDSSMDKKISKDEWLAYFVKLDKDNDGFLTEQEFTAAAQEAKRRSKDGQK
jgi:hypothetical protein